MTPAAEPVGAGYSGGPLEVLWAFLKLGMSPFGRPIAHIGYFHSMQTTSVAGFGSYDCAGYFGTLCGVVTPKWRHVLNATWSTPWHGAAATTGDRE
jgi:hypothetical protein